MRPLLCFLKVKLGPPDDDLMPVLYEILDKLFQVEGARTAIDKGHVVDGEARLERRIFEQSVQDNI